MVGYISNAVARAIRNWAPLAMQNIYPVRANDNGHAIVDTNLPAVAIHVRGQEGKGNTYLGGGIRLYFSLELFYMCEVPNFSFSYDDGEAERVLDQSEEVIRCIEQTGELDDIKQRYGMVLQFSHMETEQSVATQGAITLSVDIHKIVYEGSVDLTNQRGSNNYVVLEEVNIIKENS